ncbi:MAG: class I SAM-dependent methyltransferase [Deltaproteobacteria bacterium]|nr:class I SAM-dependent methyltransferase [Deltaproteobacteria bacterium]
MRPSISPRIFLVPGARPDVTTAVKGLATRIMRRGTVVRPPTSSQEPAYDAAYVYRREYQDRLLKGTDVTRRPWDIHGIVASKAHPGAIVVDSGCGTAYKSIRQAASVQLVIGLEPNAEMIGCAIRNAMIAGAYNVCFVTGDCDSMPFTDATVDLVVSFLAPHNAREIHRVLKPGGWAVVERVGDRDKENLKQYFGRDPEGPRGQLLHLAAGERARTMEQDFRALFSTVDAQNGFWETTYTVEQLRALLEQTPTVRHYSAAADRAAFDRLTQDLMVDGTVRTTQNRVLVVAQKH